MTVENPWRKCVCGCGFASHTLAGLSIQNSDGTYTFASITGCENCGSCGTYEPDDGTDGPRTSNCLSSTGLNKDAQESRYAKHYDVRES